MTYGSQKTEDLSVESAMGEEMALERAGIQLRKQMGQVSREPAKVEKGVAKDVPSQRCGSKSSGQEHGAV